MPDNQQPNQPEQPRDALLQLITKIIPFDRNRIKEMAQTIGEEEKAASRLAREIHGTVLPLIERVGRELHNLRSWAANSVQHHASVINDIAERVEALEQMIMGGESQLLAEDAQLLARVAHALEGMAEEAKKHTTDPAGIAKLDELLALAVMARQRIEEIEVTEDDGDDEDDDVNGQPQHAGMLPAASAN